MDNQTAEKLFHEKIPVLSIGLGGFTVLAGLFMGHSILFLDFVIVAALVWTVWAEWKHTNENLGLSSLKPHFRLPLMFIRFCCLQIAIYAVTSLIIYHAIVPDGTEDLSWSKWIFIILSLGIFIFSAIMVSDQYFIKKMSRAGANLDAVYTAWLLFTGHRIVKLSLAWVVPYLVFMTGSITTLFLITRDHYVIVTYFAIVSYKLINTYSKLIQIDQLYEKMVHSIINNHKFSQNNGSQQ